MVLRVLHPSFGVHRPASFVRSITPTILKIISPYCIHMTNSQKWGPGCPSPIETGISIVSFNVF